MAYLGGPIFRRRQQLRLPEPPGGFPPTPRKLRQDPKDREEMQRIRQREARERQIAARLAPPILLLLAVATVVLIILAVTVH